MNNDAIKTLTEQLQATSDIVERSRLLREIYKLEQPALAAIYANRK